ncbi:MAG: family 16 glycoside hydrolase [Chloroflexota bacterium]
MTSTSKNSTAQGKSRGTFLVVVTVIAALAILGLLLSQMDGRIAIVTSNASTPTNTEVSSTATIAPVIFTETTVAPVALGPQAEQARAFAEPILQAIANRPPDYEYDFNEPENGWISGMEESNTRGYVDGEYFVTVKPNGGTGAGPGKDFLFSDFVAEVDARILKATNPGGWGFIFREQPFPQSFRYHINFNSSGLSLFLNTGSYTDLFYLQGAPVQPAPGTNHLLVIAKGPNIAIYVNGEPVTVVSDSTLPSGIVSLGIHAGEQETEVRFDNFKIWDITDLTTSDLSPQAEQARAFAEPILQAVANRPPDFEDDFSIPNSRWYWTMSNDMGETVLRGNVSAENLINDALTLTAQDGLYSSVGSDSCHTMTNFVVQAELMDVDAASGGEIAAHWRVQPNADHYRFTIWLNLIPSWEVAHWVAGIRTPLASGTEKLSERGVSNQVLIVAYGPQFAIYLNGSPLTYLEDDQLTDGKTGTCNFGFGPGPMTIAIDNVKAWNLDNVPGLP